MDSKIALQFQQNERILPPLKEGGNCRPFHWQCGLNSGKSVKTVDFDIFIWYIIIKKQQSIDIIIIAEDLWI